MKVNVIIDGELIDREDNEQITVEADREDTVEDIIVKATFAVSGLDIGKTNLVYEGKIQEKAKNFFTLKYKQGENVFLRPIRTSCACVIF